MQRMLVAAGICLALVLAGCGSDDDSAPRTSASSSTSSSSSTTVTTAPCEFVGTEDAQQNPPVPVDQLLTDVTTATDGCVDTITFTFRPSAAPAPSYRIEYADAPFRNSAGETMTPPGNAYLSVRFQPAWIADLSIESAPATYTGPKRITPRGLKSVRGLALFEAYEAVVGWAIGLDARRAYSVEASPATVVIRIG